MPYLTPERRAELDEGFTPHSTGDLTYVLTREADRFLCSREERFDAYAQVLAALEATKLELYRRRIVPYEEQKLAENGDVYAERA